jgi:hypothetical protein
MQRTKLLNVPHTSMTFVNILHLIIDVQRLYSLQTYSINDGDFFFEQTPAGAM